MRPSNDVGIIGYGVYIPMYRIKILEIARVWGKMDEHLQVDEKAVAGPDEDAITMAIEAAKYAIRRAGINPEDIGAVYVGTESKPYAVKPCSTVVAEAIGATPNVLAADYEFACKAGTEAFQTSIGLIASNMVKYTMVIGVDTAQGRPADALEFTAASGGGAFIFAKKNHETIAYVEGSYSFVTDTPDFWRRDGEPYPHHTGRFTGEPAYFRHSIMAAKGLMSELGLKPSDFSYAVFHQPNTRFPLKLAEYLGMPLSKVKPGLLCPVIGNTYSGSSLIGLASVLDIAKPSDRILMVSYGSGAGSDAFSFMVQDAIEEKRDRAPKVSAFLARRMEIDYSLYVKFRHKILM
ncbi:MAG: hydroxymethylglutaryl-CoA synthase [Candidatus Nezhaarchaeota archaeon]|nr:hydroxymethylglutaryl-CoA synthase [Candidatus Nezhaarchaeota archaeon]MCX8141525.1 hydroxymethylglutaryl-CoA synthase [Candidatus Nezhaarchaeota archaeon]MDW8049792.1 hydroxymethylglutaryl-CoA synthase [Nitrososphaerota archaeon]